MNIRGLLGIVLAAWFGLAQAGEVVVTRVSAEVRQGMLSIDADARIELFQTQRDALANGVPLVFAWDLELEQARDWLWARNLARKTLRARIEFHALTRLYRIVWLDSDESATFANLGGALETLAHLRDVGLIPVAELPEDGELRGRARLRLLVDSLPLPLRPRAYFSERWQLGSEWYLWAFPR